MYHFKMNPGCGCSGAAYGGDCGCNSNPLGALENPSTGAIIGIVAGLAAAGGAAWWFLGRKDEDYDKAMFVQLDEKRQGRVLAKKPATNMGDNRTVREVRDALMKRMLNPEVHDEAYFKWQADTLAKTGSIKFSDYDSRMKRVTMADAQGLVETGKYEWLTLPGGSVSASDFTAVVLKPEFQPKAEMAKATAAANKKKGKK